MPVRQIAGFSKIRIMTSIFISAIIIAMGFVLMNWNLDEGRRNTVMVVGAILVILNLIIPTIWAFILAGKEGKEEQ